MAKLRDWVKKVSGAAKPVFVGFDAGFDWSFVNWYFIHFLGENPFGFAPLDVKAYYMGLIGCDWEETKSSRVRCEFQPAKQGDHNALTDARAQAEMFEKMRAAERP
jgi:DNA polymerase III epsilon subunit-like protein